MAMTLNDRLRLLYYDTFNMCLPTEFYSEQSNPADPDQIAAIAVEQFASVLSEVVERGFSYHTSSLMRHQILKIASTADVVFGQGKVMDDKFCRHFVEAAMSKSRPKLQAMAKAYWIAKVVESGLGE